MARHSTLGSAGDLAKILNRGRPVNLSDLIRELRFVRDTHGEILETNIVNTAVEGDAAVTLLTIEEVRHLIIKEAK